MYDNEYMREAPRSPKTNTVPTPVNPEAQKALDKVNSILLNAGFKLQPITQIKPNTKKVAAYFIKKYAKYLVSNFVLVKLPPKPAVKGNRKKKRKKK